MGNGDEEASFGPFRPGYANAWIAVAILAVSTAALFIKLSSSHPITIAFWRLLIAQIVIAPIAIFKMRSRAQRPSITTVLKLSVVGMALALHFSMWIWSFQFTTVASSVLLVTTHPIFVATLAYLLFKEKLSRMGIIGMIVALVGSLVIMGGDLTVSRISLTGNLLAFGGALMAGLYILSGRRFRRDLNLWVYVFFVYGSAMLFLLIFSLYVGADLLVTDPSEYLLFGALALGPMLLGHTVYNWALKYVSPTLVSVSLLGEPVGSTFLAFLFLGETPFIGAILGAPIVLAGIYLVSRVKRGQ
ncbi:MAG: DMT family transporter [Thermoplasmata archaeon]|nr:DMT family transporter [Thermoplasmata archaeon]